MDAFYGEICLLQLKYDNMIEMCSRLLKTWPNRDSAGKLRKESCSETFDKDVVNKTKSGANSCLQIPEETFQPEMAAASSDPPPEEESQKLDPPEMHLVDEILSRAQRIRESQPEVVGLKKKPSKNMASATKSTKMAASVYKPSEKRTTQLGKTKPPSSTAKSSSLKGAVAKSSPSTVATGKRLQSSRTHAAKLKPASNVSLSTVHTSEPAQRSQPQEQLTAGSLTSLVKKPDADSRQEQQSDSSLQDEQKRSQSKKATADEGATRTAAQACSVRRKVPWKDIHVDHRAEMQEKEESGFNIKQHGSKLTMPSKYFKLQNTLATISEHIQTAAAGPQNRAAADHFSRRLLPEETSADFAGLIQLQLAKEGYELLKEQLLSITPQEWAVSERSQWQEILKVKTKLDNIMEHFQSLQNEVQPSEHTKTSDSPSQRPSPLPTGTIPTKPLAYSSLRDWQVMAECEHKQQLSAWEAELLKFCRDVVLPKAREMQSTDRYYSSIMQLLHQLVGLEIKPIFLAVETAEQQ